MWSPAPSDPLTSAWGRALSAFQATTKFPWIIDHHPFVCGDTTPSTPQLMGGVHPSTKKHVGQRLAQAAWSLHYNHPEVAWTGPVVSACGIEKTAQGGSQLRIQFNKTLLGTDKIAVKAYSTADKASATFVRVGTPFPANAWNNYVVRILDRQAPFPSPSPRSITPRLPPRVRLHPFCDVYLVGAANAQSLCLVV